MTTKELTAYKTTIRLLDELTRQSLKEQLLAALKDPDIKAVINRLIINSLDEWAQARLKK